MMSKNYNDYNKNIARIEELKELMSKPASEAEYKNYYNQLEYLKKPTENLKTALGFSSGGLVDYTGLAMVHGSSQKPEAFLSAEQVKLFKERILGNNDHSLMSLLLDFQDAMSNLVSSDNYSSITNGSIVIEHAEVNMNGTSISNDYDARRAGEQALEEMLRIARKTNPQGIRR